MKKKIDVFDYAGTICKALPKGILVTAREGEKVNPMTIGWGHIGIEWGRPIFVAYVRKCRYTHHMIANSGEFTVNVPLETADREIIRVCGTQSGRDIDKPAVLGLHLEESNLVSAPGIRELPLTLECKVLFSVEQPRDQLPQAIIDRTYRLDMDPHEDSHTAFWGEIVDAYIITGEE